MFQNFMTCVLHNSVYKQIDQSMDYPAHEYFVYSSHNTYLKGHQLYGESSVEMYAYAISMGCRCVELDCWDGSHNEPKVTHGMTFTSDILLKDVLKNIKENAFRKTDTPFFLSIEMHCGEEQQKVMAKYFKTILVDTWCPDQDGIIPDQFPSLNELKGKFIVKCKRPKVLRKIQEKRERKYYDQSENCKKNNQLDIKRKLSVIRETEENDYSKRGTFSKHESSRYDVRSMARVEELDNNRSVIYDEKTPEEKEKIARESLKNKKKAIKEVVPDLYDLIGLISVALKLEDLDGANYQPWDVVSLSESKVVKNYKSNRSKLIEYSANSFLRVYPSGSRFDSSNYDPVKGWICGGQLVSLNLQSLSDDYTLLNHLFFRINERNGYILKPDYLRNETLSTRDYSKPCFSLQFDILSGIMLQKCLKENTTEIYLTVSVIGTYEDDKNLTLVTNSVKENFLHPIFTNSSIKFAIHEENLSFLLIKMFDNNGDVLARTVIPMMSLLQGYRNVSLFDNECHEIESSLLIVKSKKIK